MNLHRSIFGFFTLALLNLPATAVAQEACDGVDNNNDGVIDEGNVVDRSVIQMSGNMIFRIDPVTGVPSVYAGPFGVSNPNGLAAGRDADTVYAMINSSNVYELDVVTNATTLIGNVGANGGCSGLALDADGLLWCIQRNTNQLVMLDPDTGIVTGVGTGVGLDTHHGGMAYSILGDQLYMLNAINPPPASDAGILSIDRDTGLGSVLFNFSVVSGALAFDDENNVFYYSGGSVGGINTIEPVNGTFGTLTTSNSANNLTFFNLSDAQLWFRDADGDGFGDANTTLEACEQNDGSPPDGHVPNGADSDDTDPYSCRDADGDGVDDCIPTDLCADPSTATILGTAGNDYILGTPGDDIIFGLDGDDIIDGLGGNDIICGGAGSDNILGSDGNDYIEGGPGYNFLRGNEGNDILRGGDDGNELQGWGGDDTIFGGDGPDTIYGGDGNDYMSGGDGSDYMTGMDGDDTMVGGGGVDTMFGDGGNDCLGGGAGDDRLDGNAGDDCLAGGADGDVLTCNAGNDTYSSDASDLMPGGDCEVAEVCACE